MKPTLTCSQLSIQPGLELYHSGPSLDLGPLPSFFYFFSSGSDTLCQDPFNQPVQFLFGSPIRVFSMTLPAHEPPLSPKDGMRIWAEEMGSRVNRLSEFLDQAETALDFILQQHLALPDKLAVGGLSRGAFVASHFAARRKELNTLLGFAPLTCLRWIKEFNQISDLSFVNAFDVIHLKDSLYSKKIRFYIGNRDHRVNTRSCFECIETVVETAYQHRISSPPIELHLYPSIGYLGHGSPPEIFKSGSQWLVQRIGSPS